MTAKLFTIRGICLLFVLIVGGASLINAAINKRHEAYHITKVDAAFVNKNLAARNAADCIVEPANYGFRCEDKDGRIYKVKR